MGRGGAPAHKEEEVGRRLPASREQEETAPSWLVGWRRKGSPARETAPRHDGGARRSRAGEAADAAQGLARGLARRLAARKWYSSDQLLFDVPANAGAGRWVGATAGTAKWLVEICLVTQMLLVRLPTITYNL